MDIGPVRKTYLEAISYFTHKDLKSAALGFNRVIKMGLPRGPLFDPYAAKSYYFLGDIEFIRQDYALAVLYYEKVAGAYYNEDIYPRDIYKLGRTLVLSGRAGEGISVLEDYIARYGEMDMQSDHAYYWMARAYAKKGDNCRAEADYSIILSNYIKSPLTFEARNSLSALEQQDMQASKSMVKIVPAGAAADSSGADRVKEKAMLARMSKLLEIKQKLLEIKAARVDELARLKEQDWGE